MKRLTIPLIIFLLVSCTAPGTLQTATEIPSAPVTPMLTASDTPVPTARPTPKPLTVTVSGEQWGVSTCYIGANEGSSGFYIADFKDLGINTYRIYGGMSRWEYQDDDGRYGWPSIADIKADPNVISWGWWDNVMTNPPDGSDYHWSTSNGWKGNARTLFEALKTNGIRPVVVLRPVDNGGEPVWSEPLNPPKTVADWNEWWEHVFATVYWLNVRNDYGVDDWEVHNEPDNYGQGWHGSLQDYYGLVRQTHDAIDYVYRTYLPGRTYHLHSPSTVGHSGWPLDVLLDVGPLVDAVNIHNYDWDISGYIAQVHGWMQTANYPALPLWMSEWGDYAGNAYKIPVIANDVLAAGLIRASRPGNDYVYGSHIFSLYDWGTYRTGLISEGKKLAGYYTVRMMVRGLQGCKPTYEMQTGDPNLAAIATKDANGTLSLMLSNTSDYDRLTTFDLSAHLAIGTGTLWVFNAEHMDEVVGHPALVNGLVTVIVPMHTSVLLQYALP